MNPNKEDIRQWLKSEKKDRQWLAEQCYVKKSAVDKWFEKGKDIPPAKVALIKQLMDKPIVRDFVNPPGLPETELKNKLFVTLDPEKQNALEIQAHMNGMSLSAYCSLILERAADHEYEFLNDILAMFEQKWQSCEKNDAGNARNSIE